MITGLYIDRRILFLVLGIVTLIGAVLLLVGLNLQEGLWRDFLTQIGVALITATILAVATGWYLKDRLFLEIEGRVSDMLGEFRTEARDAFHLQRLPPELLDAVRSTVIEAVIVERDLFAHFEMKIVQADGEIALRAEISTSSIYENVTTEWQQAEIYEGGSSIDEHFVGMGDTGFASVATEALEASVSPPLDLDGTSVRLFVAEQEGRLIFRRSARFSPRCRIRVKSSEVAYFHLDDWDSLSAVKPTINAELKVSITGGQFRLS